MSDEFIDVTKYWFALSRIRNLGAKTAQFLVSNFGSVEAVFSASFVELAGLRGLGSELAQEIVNAGENLAEDEEFIRKTTNSGIDILCPDNIEYPYLLNLIRDPPPILYKKGTLPKADDKTIAVVGTRFPTNEGLMIAEEIAERLARKNVIVVSGLAKGIDTSAHKGSLNCGGKTIAVLGSGLNKIYPNENSGLAENICNEGSIISECLPHEIVSKGRLIQRNRITSGISLGVILIEPESGALNTAYWASKQNRYISTLDLGREQELGELARNIYPIKMDEIDMIAEELGSDEYFSLLTHFGD
jgi:DNA processing protein